MALPFTRNDRELQKFVETTGGDTAIRVVLAGMSHAEMYISSSAATNFNGDSGVYKRIAGTYSTANLANFTISSGVLTYTGVETAIYMVSACITANSDRANIDFLYRIAEDGTSIARSEARRNIATTNDFGSMSVCTTLELATNNTIEIMATVDTASVTNMTVENMTVIVRRI